MIIDPIYTNTQVYTKYQQIDATGSKMWYVNHPMDGQHTTLGVPAIANVEIQGPDGWKHLATSTQQPYIHLPALVASHDIAAGQEIMAQYNRVDGTF